MLYSLQANVTYIARGLLFGGLLLYGASKTGKNSIFINTRG
ncbi:hypothetical protein HMPREF1991_00347 [Hoylesella loescheii DSM 19665 = JCM 12249 = ATCC 15930]|uniref:Uncharacterized protein n=1 Tax=Hoylesella loescheii DSM 19665 = JCM 12249 = ATCC 15930 TaxID=1122985 RepID=A0A069QLI9_HOYLO|nr:hypothetical protein HMPREF1991_00347 [Hoylesella loescheii DSM 19665 = JCM 12249 = ATCC 15930]